MKIYMYLLCVLLLVGCVGVDNQKPETTLGTPKARELTEAEKEAATARLLTGAKAGNLIQVNEALEAGADVNAKDKGGWTPLRWAARNGYTDIVKTLIDTGANVHARDGDGRTVLMYGAGKGHRGTVIALIDKGADVNARSKTGWTALKLAARNGHKDIVALLKAAGATE